MISTIITIIVLYVLYRILRPFIAQALGETQEDLRRKQAFRLALYKVAGEVARADNKESPEEIEVVVQLVRHTLSSPHLDRNAIIREYQQYSQKPLTHEDVQGVSLPFRLVLLQAACFVAVSDRQLKEAEIIKLRRICQTLELPPEALDEILNQIKQGPGGFKSQASAVNRAYEILDLEKGCSMADIKRQYKRLAMKTHPDRVPQSEKAEATERFKEIGDAYRILKEHHA